MIPLRNFSRVLRASLVVAGCCVASGVWAIDYSRDIKPILSENCFSCHGFDEKGRKENSASTSRSPPTRSATVYSASSRATWPTARCGRALSAWTPRRSCRRQRSTHRSPPRRSRKSRRGSRRARSIRSTGRSCRRRKRRCRFLEKERRRAGRGGEGAKAIRWACWFSPSRCAGHRRLRPRATRSGKNQPRSGGGPPHAHPAALA